jgi:glycerol uptake facilitator-like aquaporin
LTRIQAGFFRLGTVGAVRLFGVALVAAASGSLRSRMNPARSFGPAVLVGGQALADLWVFILAPLAGGALAGLAHKAGLTRAD